MGSSGGFPAGLHVLVVDGDLAASKNLEKILKKSNYEVRTCNSAKEALDMLGEKSQRFRFDMIISDVNMSDMDGFKFLQHAGLVSNVPVIMMSRDGETSKVMQGVQRGACGYLLKPIRPKDVRFIWQHVYRKRMHQIEGGEIEHDLIAGNKRKELVESNGGDSSRCAKKPRVKWTHELHGKFMKAVEQIGLNNPGPTKIHELMREPSLTVENVSSHLQKHKLNMSRKNKEAGAQVSGTNIYPQQPAVMIPGTMHQIMGINENYGPNIFHNHNEAINNIIPNEGPNQYFQNSQEQSASMMKQPHAYPLNAGDQQKVEFEALPCWSLDDFDPCIFSSNSLPRPRL